jgi:hypothetical protein
MKLDAPAAMRYHGVSRLYTRHRLLIVVATLVFFGLIAKLRGTGRSRDCKGGIPLPHVLAQHQKSGATPNLAATATGWRPGARCDNYPKDASLVIVVKTGATEAYSKLPTLLLTYLSCVPPENLLFFSDIAGTVGNFAIHDALDTATKAATHDNHDFDLYYTQQEMKRLGQDMGSIRNEWKSEAAWRLDKYKNLYTAQKAWDMAPGRDWYLYIDADTYISWTNLFLWLATLDASEPLYLGSQVDVGRPPFAHGGSGYLLSKPAQELLVRNDRAKLAKEFDKNATTACCGDQELAKALFKKGLRVKNVRPVINGEKIKRFNFGPELWCTPVVTMHHVGSEEVQEMWDLENQRNSTKVCQYALFTRVNRLTDVGAITSGGNLLHDDCIPNEHPPQRRLGQPLPLRAAPSQTRNQARFRRQLLPQRLDEVVQYLPESVRERPHLLPVRLL